MKLSLSTDVNLSNVHFRILTHFEGKEELKYLVIKTLLNAKKDVLSFTHRKKPSFQHNYLVTYIKSS